MLPEQESAAIKNQIKGMENSCSVITLYLGFSKTPRELGNKYYSTFMANPDVKNLTDFANDLKHADLGKRHLIFVDYSQIDSGLAPEGKSFGVLASTDYARDWERLSQDDYKKKKAEVARVMIDRLEKLIPGIREHIEFAELGTAKTVQRYTLNPGGSCYGFAQTPEQSGASRYGQKDPAKNLHIASAWGFPGGGFTGAIIGGYLASLKVT
jgi:phytoene dehydrogenase-like protein